MTVSYTHLLQVLQAIEILNQNKVSVFIQNYNIETLTPEGEINPMSQFLITIPVSYTHLDVYKRQYLGDGRQELVARPAITLLR